MFMKGSCVHSFMHHKLIAALERILGPFIHLVCNDTNLQVTRSSMLDVLMSVGFVNAFTMNLLLFYFTDAWMGGGSTTPTR